MKRRCTAAFGWMVIAFFLLPFNSMAWGVLGHRIVGEIADSYLSPKARKEIQDILGNESIAMAANWADFIKSDTAYKYLSPWHYVDFEPGLNNSEIQAYLNNDSATDAYSKLNFLVAALKNRQLSKDKRLMYLRLVIHIVGDLHQPLHVGHTSDQGGNAVKVTWFNEPSNLHRVWDEQLIDFQQLSYTEYVKAINHTTAAQRTAWQKQPVANWIFESYAIAGQLYKEVNGGLNKFSYRYNFDHIQTVNEQLLKGGVRLAGILNQLFG